VNAPDFALLWLAGARRGLVVVDWWGWGSEGNTGTGEWGGYRRSVGSELTADGRGVGAEVSGGKWLVRAGFPSGFPANDRAAK
jgi:hypothetical protein